MRAISAFQGFCPGTYVLSARRVSATWAAPRFVTFASTWPQSERSHEGAPPAGRMKTPGQGESPGAIVRSIASPSNAVASCASQLALGRSCAAAPGSAGSRSGLGCTPPSAKAEREAQRTSAVRRGVDFMAEVKMSGEPGG